MLATSMQAQPRLDVRVQPAGPSLSDTIELDISLHGLSNSQAALLPVDISSDCVAILNVRDEAHRRIITLDPLKPGPCRIPAFRTRCIGAAKGCEVQSSETVIPISTQVTTYDIRDTEEEPIDLNTPLPNAEKLWWLLLLILPCCAGVWWYRKRSRNAAERRADKRLRATANSTEAYDIFRDYLDDRLRLGARARSTPELLAALQKMDLCRGWAADELTRFLTASDRDKFSGSPALDGSAPETCRTLIQLIHFALTRRSRAGI